jgi:hypothetical protein
VPIEGCPRNSELICSSCSLNPQYCGLHYVFHSEQPGIHKRVIILEMVENRKKLIHESKQKMKLAELRILSEGKQKIDIILQQIKEFTFNIKLREKRLNDIANYLNSGIEEEIQSLGIIQFSFQDNSFKEIKPSIDFAQQLKIQQNNLNEKMNLIKEEIKDFEEFKENVNKMLNNEMKKFKNVYEEFSLQGHSGSV